MLRGSALMENRNGPIIDADVEHAAGAAEWDGALAVLDRRPKEKRRRALGRGKGYDTKTSCGADESGASRRTWRGTSSRAEPRHRRSSTRHAGFGGEPAEEKARGAGLRPGKTVGLLDKLRHRGKKVVDRVYTFTSAAYDLVRLRTLTLGGVCP